MEGKGLIKFFLIVMLIVSAYTFALFIPTNRIENQAQSYATSQTAGIADENQKNLQQRALVQSYLDSVSKKTALDLGVFKFTYLDLKAQQLALGLDLKGGMSVVVQVDLKEMVIELSDKNESPEFTKALNLASERQAATQSDYITLLVDAYNEVAPGRKLAPIFQAKLGQEIPFNATNNEVRSVLRAKASETVTLTFTRLKQRIDKFGVTQPNVTLDETTDRIMVELPGIDNPERARELISSTAKLEFFDVYLPTEVLTRLQRADKKLKEKEDARKAQGDNAVETQDTSNATVSQEDTATTKEEDTASVKEDTASTKLLPSDLGPIFSKLAPNPFAGQPEAPCFIGTAAKEDKATILKLLQSSEVSMPKNLKFLWSEKANKDDEGNETNQFNLYAVKTVNGEAPLEGDVITSADANLDQESNRFVVNVNMSGRNGDGVSGSQIWAKMTTANAPTKRQVAIVLDDEVVSAPAVQNAITTGRTQISGDFDSQEATDLANILQVGKLPAKARIIEENIVGPSLGRDNINTSLIAITIGFVIVLLFMMIYYGSAGIISVITLLLNIIFIFGSLAQLGTVLTLPGFAGVILTIGMAVDANVIIYERIREELLEGKSMLTAIQDGFKASYSSIIDANVTTILTGIILYQFGLGPIKGFAAILVIGVISSLFTAVLVGRLLIEWWLNKGKDLTFSSKLSEGAFSNWNFDFIKARKISYGVSGAVILVGLISFFTLGFELGVDFKGGYSYAVQFDKNTSADEIRTVMTDIFGEEPVVKSFGGNNTYEITTSYMATSNAEDADKQVLNKLFEGVQKIDGKMESVEDFAKGKYDSKLTRSIKVGAAIADDIRVSAFYAAIFALLVIFLYIFIRFLKWQYSLAAVIALFHDVLIVLSIFSIGQLFIPFSLEINQVFIGAILTLIGYSINDTVIVFDRIRESVNTYTHKDKKDLFNSSINSTISRTSITSLTTLFTVIVLLFFGGSSIKGFAFALVVGITVGTYSSIFIASPIVYDTIGDLKAKVVGKSSKPTTSKYGGRKLEDKA
jgi:SecD/SecF fusion protein